MARSCPHCWMCPGGQCGVDMLVDIPAHRGSATLLHITFSFPSRAQPASTSDSLPFPQIWVLGWCELVSWHWETLQPKSPPLRGSRKEGQPCLSHSASHPCQTHGNLGKVLLGAQPSAGPHLIPTLVFMRCVLLCCCSRTM